MNFLADWFPLSWLVTAWVVLAVLLAATARSAFASLKANRGAVAVSVLLLSVLWSLRAGVAAGQLHDMTYHLLGLSLVTLMLNAAAALWLGSLLLGVYLTILQGWGAWSVWGMNALATVLPPVAVCWALQRLASSKLPHHLFVYIFINGFLAAALGMLATGVVVITLLDATDLYAGVALWSSAFVVFFLITWGEAFLSGILTAIFVALAPQLLSTFDDQRYLQRQADVWK